MWCIISKPMLNSKLKCKLHRMEVQARKNRFRVSRDMNEYPIRGALLILLFKVFFYFVVVAVLHIFCMLFSNTFRKTRNPVFTFTGEWRRMHEIRIRSNWNAFWFTNFGWLRSFFSLFTRAAHIVHFATEFICLRLTFHRLDASNRVQPSTQTLSMYSNSNNFMYTPLHTSIRTHRSSLSLVCYILLACWLCPFECE